MDPNNRNPVLRAMHDVVEVSPVWELELKGHF